MEKYHRVYKTFEKPKGTQNSSSAEYILISGNLRSSHHTEPGSPIPVPTTTKFGSLMFSKKR